jgi:hypothetical protein
MALNDLFISYSRKNAEFVRRLHGALSAQQRDIWADFEDIPLTADWWREITQGIESANVFAFIITPDSLESPICNLEVAHAISLNKRIVPIMRVKTDEVAPHAALAARTLDQNTQALLAGRNINEIARTNWQTLTRLNWLFFDDDSKFDANIATLGQVIDTDLAHVRTHTQTLVRARQWAERQHDPSFLLNGTELKEAEAFLANMGTKQPLPTPLHLEFIGYSRTRENARLAEEQRLQNLARNRLRLVIGLLVVSVVATILAFVGFWLFTQNLTRELNDRNFRTLLQTAAFGLNGEEFLALLRDGVVNPNAIRNNERYLRQVAWLDNLSAAGLNTRFYTLALLNDGRVLIVARNSGDGRGTLEAIRNSPAEIAQAFDGTITINYDSYTDAAGRWLSGYAPIYNARQQVVGVLGADVLISAYDVERERIVTIGTVLTVLFVLVLAGGTVGFLLFAKRQDTQEQIKSLAAQNAAAAKRRP